MTTVFVLQHEHEWCGRDEVKFIGVYETAADAKSAIARLRVQPGFRDWPEGFAVSPHELGVDGWTEGFQTIVQILVPSRTVTGVFQVAGSVWRPGDLYEISEIPSPEEARFCVGDLVRCQEQAVAGHGESVLVATEAVRNGAE